MNKSNFNQTGGYPLKTERLQELETAYTVFNALGTLAGNLTIISGCDTVGSTVKNGVIFINGELFEFREASVNANSRVLIIEESISSEFEDGSIKQIHTIRYATFGTSDVSWAWSDFKRPIETKAVQPALDLKADKTTTDSLDAEKADNTTVENLQIQFQNLQTVVNNLQLQIPKIQITTGQQKEVSYPTAGEYYNDFSKNYIDVYPPPGYSMSSLAGFTPSIAQIQFAGDVDSNDGFWCRYIVDASKIRVICGSREMRSTPQVNYVAVWIKY